MAPVLSSRQAGLLPIARGRRKWDLWGEESSQTWEDCWSS